MTIFSGSINSNAWVGAVPLLSLLLSDAQITKESLLSDSIITKESLFSNAQIYDTFSGAINSDARITKESLLSDAQIYDTFTGSVFSDAIVTKESLLSDAYIYTSGSFTTEARGGIVLGRGTPISSSRDTVIFGEASGSSETVVNDIITSSALDLATANTPLTYDQYNWAYDWVTRQWNGCIVKFETRQHNTAGELTGESWQEIQNGELITNVKRYHQWRAHVWASGSQDFELFQFTIKAYVNYSANASYMSVIR